jgi:glyoxalase/bleomycin resistance protein/dioxygenase superfamily protein
MDRYCAVSAGARFKAAFPYQDDVLALPVRDLDVAAQWYTRCFGMAEVERRKEPTPTVILERDGTRLLLGKRRRRVPGRCCDLGFRNR